MGSDRARFSYDEKQQYRSVVMQQGRVTLEADWNEEHYIVGEEMRKEVLDIVGPAGTPDDGYRVHLPQNQAAGLFNFLVTTGTMYVGGLRVELLEPEPEDWPVSYFAQPDWLHPTPPQLSPPASEFVYLNLHEQEISAVEDSALLEVALGGPDTAQRTRIMQYIRRVPVDANACAPALEQQRQRWKQMGLVFDPETMRLMSESTLEVGFTQTAGQPDPCKPGSQSGYLGAENQLIRVQITDDNKILWGYDNAFFLYRVESVGSDNKTLKLKARPVDEFHRPRADQFVEVLNTSTQLSNGEYVAALTGIVAKLPAAYDADLQTVTLPAALPPSHRLTGPNAAESLFLRVWEEELTFTPGVPVALGDTGLQVTLALKPGGTFCIGDYWTFAVRPGTSSKVFPAASEKVYPERYIEEPQPPEGPRRWVCPLAVINWTSRATGTVVDCRNHFDNLVELTKRRGGGCCTVLVTPETAQQRGLQSILDDFQNQERVTVCLMPGTYELREPIRLRPGHSNLTFEGCHAGVILRPAAGTMKNFLDGLIVVVRATNVTLKGLELRIPIVPFLGSGGRFAGLTEEQMKQIADAIKADAGISFGVRAAHAAGLKVENCVFKFTNDVEEGGDNDLPIVARFGVGVFAIGNASETTVSRNQFLAERETEGGGNDTIQGERGGRSVLLGYALTPSLQFNLNRQADTPGGFATRKRDVKLLTALIDEARMEDNEFEGLALSALVWSETGSLHIVGNAVHECYAGFWLMSMRWLFASGVEALSAFGKELTEAVEQLQTEAGKMTIMVNGQKLSDIALFLILQLLLDPRMFTAMLVTLFYPLPGGFDLEDGDPFLLPAQDQATFTQPEFNLMQTISNSAEASFGGARFNQPNTAEATGFAADAAEATLADKNPQAFNLVAQTVGLAISAVSILIPPRPTHQLQLVFSHNTVDAFVKNGPSGNALFVWDTDEETNSEVTISANQLQNKSQRVPTAAILMPDRCSITGNLVLNELRPGQSDDDVIGFQQPAPTVAFWSLLLIPGAPPASGTAGFIFTPLVAVTGNVCRGGVILPQRPMFPPPLNTWEPLNTVSVF